MEFGVSLCNHGAFADPGLLVDLAVMAEEHGWDGVFLWDHIARAGEPVMTDPWIALAAIAARTSRVTIGPLVTPLARRRPAKVARETVSLDRLSGGRTILGVGLGVHPEEFANLGEESDQRAMAARLDEALEVITALWTTERVSHHGPAFDVDAWFRPGPVQTPRIPIWVAGHWPNKPPMRRAARWDGVVPASNGDFQPDDYRDMLAYIAEHRDAVTPFTTVHMGHDRGSSMADWQAYADAGVDWWVESFKDELRTVDECRALIAAGPPAALPS